MLRLFSTALAYSLLHSPTLHCFAPAGSTRTGSWQLRENSSSLVQGLVLGGGLVQGLLLGEGLVQGLVSREGWCKKAGLVYQQLRLGLVEWQGLLGINHREKRLLLGLLKPVVVTAWCRGC